MINTSILDMFDSDNESPPSSPPPQRRRLHTIQTVGLSANMEINREVDPIEISAPVIPHRVTSSQTIRRQNIPLPILEPMASRQNLKKLWPCIDKTMYNPVSRSRARTRANLKQFIITQLKGLTPHQAEPEDWMCWLINWASPRGRCKYGDDTKGISPASAKIYFKLLVKLLAEDFKFLLLKTYPFLFAFPREWQKSITKIRLYERKQAGFFSQADVRLYIEFLSGILSISF